MIALGVALGLVAAIALRVWWLKRRVTWSAPAERRDDLPLAARVLGDAPPTYVLLHGLAGSGRYFGAEYDALAADARLLVPDLLGFGASRQRGEQYTLETHLEALRATVSRAAPTGPLVLVGHSMGSILALALARAIPHRVDRVVAISPVLYRDRDQAQERISAMGPLVRLFALETPAAKKVCGWMCAHREAAGYVAIAARPGLPTTVAKDGVQHTWRSYTGALKHVLMESRSAGWLVDPPCPITLVYGTADAAIPRALLESLTGPEIRLSPLPGGHDLPLTHTNACLAAIRGAPQGE